MSEFEYPFRLDLKDGQWRDLKANAFWAATLLDVGRACVAKVRESLSSDSDFEESEILGFQFDYDGNRYKYPWLTK